MSSANLRPSRKEKQTPKNGTAELQNNERKATPGHQYGGNHRDGWLSLLPESWLPYVQLARLSPPAGLFLIYFPHAFGILHAAIMSRSSPAAVSRAAVLMFGGSFFVSNAIHIWNDVIDAPLDAQVERTRNRPIPRGAITPSAAIIFTATQAIGATVFLPFMSVGFLDALLYTLPSVAGWTYYPWAKRHVSAPQFVLGFCLGWGAIMGSLSLGAIPYTISLFDPSRRFVDPSTLCLFGANILWTMIYDTIYAHQDLQDDLKAGIKSLAVVYRDRTKTLLWQLLAVMSALLTACGFLNDMSIMYYLVAVGGATGSLASMITLVELKNSESCWWWFGNGFWYAGCSIAGGLLLEYVVLVTPMPEWIGSLV
ncbi:hypothetical protein MMC10_006761 [Thelotrema lepadinum]|nr:hypothetical protein [Thelotrema lepadinum]